MVRTGQVRYEPPADSAETPVRARGGAHKFWNQLAGRLCGGEDEEMHMDPAAPAQPVVRQHTLRSPGRERQMYSSTVSKVH